MTFVEFFDKDASENISACLAFSVSRVIYIGNNARLMKRHISSYEKVFSSRGQKIEFLFKTVSKCNLDSAVKVISEIVEAYDDCVFDILGGEEILNLALGIVYSKYPDRNIQIHKFNLNNNVMCDCDKNGETVFFDAPALSVEENVRIYGGDVVYGGIGETNTYKWKLSPELVRDVDLMWDICKKDVRYWNSQMGILEAVQKLGKHSPDGLSSVVNRDTLDLHFSYRGSKNMPSVEVLEKLFKNGLLTRFDLDGEALTVSYKNEQVKRCLGRAGQILEMKVFVTAVGLKDGNGAPIYNDALNGVVIDWDGELHDERVENVYDTENEVDVFLMHGMVPVFISCKNGAVGADELYKLNTVAHRFGGKYAKKVLIATAVSSMGEAGHYLRQRAVDMNIRLIDDFHLLSDASVTDKLKNLWQG